MTEPRQTSTEGGPDGTPDTAGGTLTNPPGDHGGAEVNGDPSGIGTVDDTAPTTRRRRSFLKGAGLAAGGLVLGSGAISDVGHASVHSITLGENKRFMDLNYSYLDPASGFEQSFTDGWSTMRSAGTWLYTHPDFPDIRNHYFTATAISELEGSELTAVARWGQTFPVEGSGSQDARIDVSTGFVAEEITVQVFHDYHFGSARVDFDVVLEDRTAGSQLFERTIYSKVLDRTDTSSPQHMTGDTTIIDTAIPVTLVAGREYRVYVEVRANVRQTYQGGGTGTVDTSAATAEARVRNVSVAFDGTTQPTTPTEQPTTPTEQPTTPTEQPTTPTEQPTTPTEQPTTPTEQPTTPTEQPTTPTEVPPTPTEQPPEQPPSVPPELDLTGDGSVGGDDVVEVRQFIRDVRNGDAEYDPAYDFDGDGDITARDLVAFNRLTAPYRGQGQGQGQGRGGNR